MSQVPVAERLATPSDLAGKARRSVAEALNPLVADAFALYLKTKNYHWHVSGPHFRDYHLLLDEQAEQVLAVTDLLAERARKLGQLTVHSIGEVARLQRIEDDDRAFVEPAEMLRILMDDNRALAEHMRRAHQACESAGDVASASLLETFIDEAERRVWFLYEAAEAV
ncbi:MAG TPA: DNA starvation/stationary phase protection protein [Candidatus Dormibacteraeota bacterium]|jgi:starvation-inducible DNA-binding protein|nr:DNA starvation/stationary phase protection protein [Candidatus Dormibacteraeota bacterium]